GDGTVHVVLARLGGDRDDFLGVRVDDLDPSAPRIDPFAADVELVRMLDAYALGDHVGSPRETRLGQKLLKIVRLRESSGLPARCSASSRARVLPCSSIRNAWIARTCSGERRSSQRGMPFGSSRPSSTILSKFAWTPLSIRRRSGRPARG